AGDGVEGAAPTNRPSRGKREATTRSPANRLDRRMYNRGRMQLKMKGFWSAAALSTLTAVLSAQNAAPPKPERPAGQSDRPTFSVQVDLVTTDVIPRDEKGNFVADLRKDEFEVYEDGVKQDITSMTLSHGGRASNLLAPPPPPPPEGIILPPVRK